MKEYKIIVEKTAELDLESVFEYIAVVLKEKEAALKLYKKLKEGITSLSFSPGRCSLVDEKRLKEMMVRRLIVNNYSIFYYIDNEAQTVHILRILYNRRNWTDLVTN